MGRKRGREPSSWESLLGVSLWQNELQTSGDAYCQKAAHYLWLIIFIYDRSDLSFKCSVREQRHVEERCNESTWKGIIVGLLSIKWNYFTVDSLSDSSVCFVLYRIIVVSDGEMATEGWVEMQQPIRSEWDERSDSCCQMCYYSSAQSRPPSAGLIPHNESTLPLRMTVNLVLFWPTSNINNVITILRWLMTTAVFKRGAGSIQHAQCGTFTLSTSLKQRRRVTLCDFTIRGDSSVWFAQHVVLSKVIFNNHNRESFSGYKKKIKKKTN